MVILVAFLKYLFSLPLLHIGDCDVQLPELPHVLMYDADKEYPELHEKEATVPTGYPNMSNQKPRVDAISFLL